jgi:chorismate mutase
MDREKQHKFTNSWIQQSEPYLIAGPCSAETEDQVMETARQLVESNRPQLFRAGIWKPRTRPNSFEGVGEKGLPWLKRVKEEFGLPVTIEVANADHVEKALKHGIDVLWIGARTTVSPFAVQEIAESLRGVDIPVMIKNPINPDYALWVGAIERLLNTGNNKLAAIHRGFSSISSEYRNTPNWEIPIKLKTDFPDLKIICDPSHISGQRNKVFNVAQKALDLDFDGLMIETHISPDDAWSDSQQQITPQQLIETMSLLTVRSNTSKSATFQNQLEQLRSQIDEIDAEILKALAKRKKIVGEIGSYKKDNDVTILQLERWREILDTRIPFGEGEGLDRQFVELLLQLIHDESIKVQTDILNERVFPDNKG